MKEARQARFSDTDDYTIRYWWTQYSKPSQACFYPNMRRFRLAVGREMKARCLTPLATTPQERPRQFMWGLGGRFNPAGRLP